jgi:hypothetical protein
MDTAGSGGRKAAEFEHVDDEEPKLELRMLNFMLNINLKI